MVGRRRKIVASGAGPQLSIILRLSSAPKGRDIPAQGNALGPGRSIRLALKGRDMMAVPLCHALSGLGCVTRRTQGVALGWYVRPRWGQDIGQVRTADQDLTDNIR